MNWFCLCILSQSSHLQFLQGLAACELMSFRCHLGFHYLSHFLKVNNGTDFLKSLIQ